MVNNKGLMTWSGRALGDGRCEDSAWLNLRGRPSISLGLKGREAAWDSPMVDFGSKPLQPGDEIIVSCVAEMPGRSHVKVRLLTLSEDEWHEHEMGEIGTEYPRTSIADPGDDHGEVAIDVFVAKKEIQAYIVRVELIAEGISKPRVFRVTSQAVYATKQKQDVPATTMTETTVLAVRKFKQMVQDTKFTGLGGGGWAWCNAAAMAAILFFWKTGPSEQEIKRLMGKTTFRAYNAAERLVYAAAAGLYDIHYNGTGNWLMSIAYAGRFLDGWLCKFSSLLEVEKLIKAGVPLIASISWKKGQWPGAAIDKSGGHLVVICGVTAEGNILIMDPRQESDDPYIEVDRALFDEMWRQGSGRLGYVIQPV